MMGLGVVILSYLLNRDSRCSSSAAAIQMVSYYGEMVITKVED